MATELHDLTVPAFTRGLTALDAILDNATAHAANTGADSNAYLALRLIDDMNPFSKQVQTACDSPKLCLARLSDIPAPVMDDSEATIGELKGRITATLDYLKSVPRDAVNGQEDKPVVLTFPGGEMRFTGRDYVVGFALPNFYFHLTAAYALLRQAGVPLGKRDFLGGR